MTSRSKESHSGPSDVVEYTIDVEGQEVRVRETVAEGRRGPRHAAELIAPDGQTAIVDAISHDELVLLVREAVKCFISSLPLR